MSPFAIPALRASVAFVALLSASCASYTEKTAVALHSFEVGRFDDALETLSDREVVESSFLRGAECGMVALVAGDWEGAQQHFDRAAKAVNALEERAVLGPTELGESLTTLFVNESAATYPGEGYERVQLHAALALTYLARGDRDGVYVETRRANKLLETEEQLYSKKYAAGGLGHFMSALSYELQQRFDDAYIDYKRMDEKGVGSELAGKALVRIAARLRYDDALPELVARYGDAPQIPADAANIVVIAGVGIGPFKVPDTVSLMTPSGLAQFSVPRFAERPQPVGAVQLVVDGGLPVQSSVIEDVRAVARENLSDRLGWLALRSGLRAALKLVVTDALAQSASDKHGELAGFGVLLAGSLLTAATERADTRSWLTVPDTWQAARLFVAPGERELELEALGGERVRLGRFQLEPGETVIVLARTLGTHLYTHVIGGRRLDASPAQISTPAASTPAQP